jgi:serine/threonine-protein kinase
MNTSSKFGKYRLIAELGQGGMATVFLAIAEGPEGLGFSKLVVVKRLRGEFVDDPEFVGMLVDEARLAARLNHPNAVQTYEIGEVNGNYFIAMEFLEGQSLSRIESRAERTSTPLPLNYQLSILADVLTGLHHAHELRDYDGSPLHVVHRDVTPQNVFVTYDGQVKIVDFGIAKAAKRMHETKQGVIKGKLVYMAPEQAMLADIDRRADVFAVGAMMWQALTGQRMWNGNELTIIKRLVTNDMPPAPSAVRPDVDPTLDAICRKALSWKKEDRYATAEEMAGEIIAWLNARGERPLPRDVGALVTSMFTRDRQRVTEVIEEQLAHLSATPNSGAFKVRSFSPTSSGGHEPLSSALLTPPETSTDGAVSVVVEFDPAASASATSASKRRAIARLAGDRGRRRAGALLGGAVAVLAAALVLRGAVRSSAHAEAATETSSAAVTIASASVDPQEKPKVVVTLTSSAPSASFRIDDGPPVEGPFTGRFPKDDAVHVVTASAPGHETERRELRFREDVAVGFELRKRSPSPRSAPPPTAAAAPAPREPAPAAARAEAPPQPAAAPARPPAAGAIRDTSRSQRPIDEDNPYGR